MVVTDSGFPKLKKLLNEKGVNEEIAALIGVSDTRLDYILNGTIGFDFYVSHIIKICDHLEIDMDDYFF
ncbi:helix-turn-helix transcriptional regulator [Lentibacillus sp. N15]|uniref:helix-turn-helix domain-containing protein n=1 Tax=Lentibacillus songyuanensis TaxID=3136161 RepID=UPI0031B9E413